jgi:hypothetical protein
MSRASARKLRKLAKALPPPVVFYEVKSFADGTEGGIIIETGVNSAPYAPVIEADAADWPHQWPEKPAGGVSTPEGGSSSPMSENQRLLALADELLRADPVVPRRLRRPQPSNYYRHRDPLDWP